MQVVALNRLWVFSTFDYMQTDGRILGYQCEYCKWVYAQGRYGLEVANLIVCHKHLVRCPSCDGLLPSPVLWNSLTERESFIAGFHMKGGNLKFRPMTREWPVRVLCPVDP